MESISRRRARFGAFELDVKTGELHRGKRRILLQEQPFRILKMLVECGSDVATREDIRSMLWPDDTVVEFDHGINRAIRTLRQTLGDSAENPKYIETVARRGYRLLPAVEWEPTSEVTPATRWPMQEHRYKVPPLHFGDRIHLTIELSRSRSNDSLDSYTNKLGVPEVLGVESDIPHDVPVLIQVHLTNEIQAQLGLRRPVRPEVLEAYLQGNYHLRKFSRNSGDEEKKRAAEYFQLAIEADPNFAPAYNGLAQAHQDLLLGSIENVVIARRAAERAIELDPAYSEARARLAMLKWKPDLDLQGSETEFKRAIALDYYNPDAHRDFAIFLNEIGRVDEGLRECRIAQQLSPGNVAWLPYSLFYCRDYDAAIATAQMMLLKDPDDGFLHLCLYSAYMKKGMCAESVESVEKAVKLWGMAKVLPRVQESNATSGPLGAIRQLADEFEGLQTTKQAFLPGNLAKLYTILGDKDRAFFWLDQGLEQREMASGDGGVFPLKGNPIYDPLRSDPRYKDLIRRMSLPA